MAPNEMNEELFVKYFISALSNIDVVGKLKDANSDLLNEIKNLKDNFQVWELCLLCENSMSQN